MPFPLCLQRFLYQMLQGIAYCHSHRCGTNLDGNAGLQVLPHLPTISFDCSSARTPCPALCKILACKISFFFNFCSLARCLAAYCTAT